LWCRRNATAVATDAANVRFRTLARQLATVMKLRIVAAQFAVIGDIARAILDYASLAGWAALSW